MILLSEIFILFENNYNLNDVWDWKIFEYWIDYIIF